MCHCCLQSTWNMCNWNIGTHRMTIHRVVQLKVCNNMYLLNVYVSMKVCPCCLQSTWDMCDWNIGSHRMTIHHVVQLKGLKYSKMACKGELTSYSNVHQSLEVMVQKVIRTQQLFQVWIVSFVNCLLYSTDHVITIANQIAKKIHFLHTYARFVNSIY